MLSGDGREMIPREILDCVLSFAQIKLTGFLLYNNCLHCRKLTPGWDRLKYFQAMFLQIEGCRLAKPKRCPPLPESSELLRYEQNREVN